MPPVSGGDLLISVAAIATPTVFSPVGDMNSYRRGSSRGETRHSVFGRTLQYIVPGRRDQTMEIGGFLTLADAGQVILRTAEANKTDVVIKILFDGTNGFTQQCSVSSFSHDANPDDLENHGFTLVPSADATIIAAGPIL